MDVDRMKLAVANGVSVVCATCKRYWEGREQRLLEPRCTAKKPCGSPFAGMTFPEYDGPITEFSRFCFVCGGEAIRGVRVREDPRVFGLCESHLGMLGVMQPVGLDVRRENDIDVLHGSERLSLQHALSVPKKTLGQVIAETEAELAAEESKR